MADLERRDQTDAPLLAIVGPTASGKTGTSIRVAERLGAEIVSVDSSSVYRGMDVGTDKPTLEQRAAVPHHLIDVADPSETFTVARYQELARASIREISSRGHRTLLVGGSGLYFRAVVDDLVFPPTDPTVREELEREAVVVGARTLHGRLAEVDPVAAERIEPDNVRRTVRALEVSEITGRRFSSFAEAWERYPPGRVRAAGIDLPRAVLAERIERRLHEQLARGLLQEIEGLLRRGFERLLTASRAIGYAEFARHLDGTLTLEEAIAQTVKRTKALARRQLAWFRRDPRIRWIPTDGDAPVDEVTEYLRG
ncbi:MAG: tRNA (adenosine(37)-N6)-dimethylallyltransferase MiaA [Actinobacteria bacterium]|nr:tRNA (adenosine(37)-N6)-dimethylallyltransferase MiaA [Actinomycetota bacterium]